MGPGDRVILDREKLDHLFEALAVRGYEVIGPTVKDGALVYDKLASAADLPQGVGDEQSGGRYRLTRRDDGALFGYVVGAHSWKRFLHPPLLTLWRARRSEGGFELHEGRDAGPRYAFLGVRACELAAIAVQDRVFLGGSHVDPSYEARRREVFLVAVNCGQAGGSCFCVSTRDRAACEVRLRSGAQRDPRRRPPLPDRGRQRAWRGGGGGAAHAGRVGGGPPCRRRACPRRPPARWAASSRPRGSRSSSIATTRARAWDEVAKRCLTCANCTMVCPTCFCVSVEDAGDLTGTTAERRQRWDSCFTSDFSYIHGGSVRTSARSRYRQWITHKLAAWQDQFGTLGCVGCGRCITWCPVGIDITEEVKALRESEAAPSGGR